MRVFHYVIKKRRRALTPDSFFFFNDSDIFLKYFNSNQNLSSYSLFSKCFSWFFYLGVHRGTGVFWWLFFIFYSSSRTRGPLSRSPRACLRLTEKRWKIAPVLQIQASSMKLRVHGFLFLVFLHIKTDGKNKLFFYNHINIQIRRFFSELVDSKSYGKYCPMIIQIGTNTALLAFSRSLGM